MKRDTILVTGADLPAAAVEILRDYTIIYAGRVPSQSDLNTLMKLHDPVGIIVRYGRVTAEIIQAGRKLKAISKYGSGVDTIDTVAAKQHKVAVCAAVGINAASVAEHTIALMLACSKSIPTLNTRMHSGHWDKSTHRSIELRGRTLGLVGLGAIGNYVASVAKALEMKVIGYDPYATTIPQGVSAVSLKEIWSEADVISLHCPLTDETRNLLDAACFEAVKPGAIIINTARGGIISEADLLTAIKTGKVSWAGLDSFSQEPPPADHPFFGEERIILSPHIGAVSEEAYIQVGIAACKNLLEALQNKQ